jgi:hypothetical protein
MRLALLFACSLHAATVAQIACGIVGDPGQGGYAWTNTDQVHSGGASLPYMSPYNALRASNGPDPITYTLTVPTGPATVTLRFIEPNKTAAGQRVFTIAINGNVQATNYDLFALAGLLVPYSQVYQVTSTGTITIVLMAITGKAVISGIQVDVPDAPPPWEGVRLQCEDGPSTGGYGNGGLLPSSYGTFSCENMSGGPMRITKFRCRSDVDGQIADLQVKDSADMLHSVLTAPIDCPPQGAEAVILPGAVLPDKSVLWWFTRVVEPTDPGAPLVKQVLMTAILEP